MSEQNKSEELSWGTWVEQLTQLPLEEQLTTLLTKVKEQRKQIEAMSLSESLSLQKMQELELQLLSQAEKIEKLNASDEEQKKALELQKEFQAKAEALAKRVQELDIREENIQQRESQVEEEEQEQEEQILSQEERKPRKKISKKLLLAGMGIVMGCVLVWLMRDFLLQRVLRIHQLIDEFALEMTVDIEDYIIIHACVRYTIYFGCYAVAGFVAYLLWKNRLLLKRVFIYLKGVIKIGKRVDI